MKHQSYLSPVDVVDEVLICTYINKGRDKEYYINRAAQNGAIINWS